MLSNVSSKIPQETKDYISQAQKELFNREHLRSISVFFGIGEERPFYVEKVPSLLMERLRHNVAFFYLNYMLLTAVLFVLTLLISPSAIIGIGLLALAWMYVIKTSNAGAMQIYGTFFSRKMTFTTPTEPCVPNYIIRSGLSISQKQATIVMAIISVIVLLYLLSNVFWYTLFSSGFLSGFHVLLRDASMHKDEDDKVQMSGDLDLAEDSAFLNPAQVDKV
jgi:hypothetical protein